LPPTPQGRLEKLLQGMGAVTDPKDLRAIMHELEEGQLQLACRAHWKALHPGGDAEAVGNHPNEWFDESAKYHKKLADTKAGTVPAPAAGAVQEFKM
jgi:DNA primase large subunit